MIVTACTNNFQKVLKSTNMDYKEKMAIKYYNEKNYDRALQLFDELRIFNKGSLKAEEIAFYYANCYFGMNDFYTAGFYYKDFVNTFPNSKHAEECAYLAAYCKYMESPKYNLDQTITKDAIKEFQLFIDMYPTSNKVEEANNKIDELRAKLQKKDFENAKLYYVMEDYKAAIISFRNLLKEYLDTIYKEDALYYIAKAYYNYASKSIEQQKYLRFKSAIESANNFKLYFPNSKYKKDIEQIIKISSKEIVKYKS